MFWVFLSLSLHYTSFFIILPVCIIDIDDASTDEKREVRFFMTRCYYGHCYWLLLLMRNRPFIHVQILRPNQTTIGLLQSTHMGLGPLSPRTNSILENRKCSWLRLKKGSPLSLSLSLSSMCNVFICILTTAHTNTNRKSKSKKKCIC